jgi:DNA polymerase-1
MQVHDELVFEVPAGLAPEFGAVLREHMVNAATLSVPLRVDVGTGANWDEAH